MRIKERSVKNYIKESENDCAKHTNLLITKLNLPIFKPCKCRYCYKNASAQCINTTRDASVGITKDQLVPAVPKRSFLAMTDGYLRERVPKVMVDRGITAHFSPVRERTRREDGTQTNIVKNKDIDMIMQVFDELNHIKKGQRKYPQQSVETFYECPRPRKDLEIKEIRIHRTKTKLKTNLIKEPNVQEPKKIGDHNDIKKGADDKIMENKNKLPTCDKLGTRDLCGQVTISISRTKDFPEIRFQILSGLGADKAQSKQSNDTEREKIISTFNYVQSKTGQKSP